MIIWKHSSPYTKRLTLNIIISNRECKGCLILNNFLTCYNSQAWKDCTVRWPSIWLPGNSYSCQRWIDYPTREGESSQHVVCPTYDYPSNIQTPLLSTVATPSLSCSLNREGCLFLMMNRHHVWLVLQLVSVMSPTSSCSNRFMLLTLSGVLNLWASNRTNTL